MAHNQLNSDMSNEYDFPDELPELTDAERAALESIPDDAVSHWWNGEKWDFKTNTWVSSVDTPS